MRLIPTAALAVIALVAVLAAACGDSASGQPAPSAGNPESLANAAALQSTANGAAEGISVSGTGRALAEPDTALLSMGVSVLADSAREARDRAAGHMNALLDSVKGNGIDDKDIHTTQFALNPEYSYPSNGTPVLRGYRLTNSVSVTVRDLDRVPEVIDEAVEAVGDPIQISGVTFTIEDPEALLAGARAKAMADAKAKAQQLAELGGVTLGRPIAINEGSTGGPPPVFYHGELAQAAADQATPIEPGQLELSVNVSVTYAIE